MAKNTTYIVRIDNADGFDARSTMTVNYTHAAVAGDKGQEAAMSWHTSAELARKAAEKFSTGRVVEAFSRNGNKVTVVKQLKRELAETPAEEAPAKKAEPKKAPAAKKAPGKPVRVKGEVKKADDPRTMAGYRTHTKSRSSKTTAVLVDGQAQGLDTEGGRWQTICLDHDFIVAHSGQRVARDVLGHPEEWCEPCRKAFRKSA